MSWEDQARAWLAGVADLYERLGRTANQELRLEATRLRIILGVPRRFRKVKPLKLPGKSLSECLKEVR